jgi:hypothetical protein
MFRTWILMLTFLVLLVLTGCNVSITNPTSTVFSAPGRSPVTYSVSPLSLDAFSSITPLGNLNPPSHTFPSNHIYFVLNPGVWEIRAPADGIITGLRSETSNDYNIYIAHTSTFETQFRHVEKLADWILNQTGQLEPAGENDEPQIKVNIPVKACDIIATTEIHSSGGHTQHCVDMYATNLEVFLPGFIYPEHQPPNEIHRVSALDYFEKSLQESLYNKVKRTAEPRGGKIDFDQPGRLVGDWFAGTNDPSKVWEWASQLAFVYDVDDPTQVRITVGGTLATGVGVFSIDNNAPDPATISTASGLAVYHLQGVWENSGNYTLLVKMLDDERIEVEAFPGSLFDAQFTTAAVIYHR